MTDKKNTTNSHEDEFDASALEALARPSLPEAIAEADDADDEGVLDLSALTTSLAPPAPQDDEAVINLAATEEAPVVAEPVAATIAESAVPEDQTPHAVELPARDSIAPVVNTVAPVAAAESNDKKSNAALPIVAILAAAATAGIVFFVFNGGSGDAETAASEIHATDVQGATALGSTTASAEETPAIEEPAVEEAVGEESAVEDVVADDEALETEEAIEEEEVVETDEPAVDPFADLTPAEREARLAEIEARRAEREAEREAAAEQAAAAAPATPAPAQREEVDAVDRAIAAPARTGGSSQGLDDLLDRAVGEPARPAQAQAAQAAPEPSADLPETPSQSSVQRALGGLMPAIRACAGDQVGIAAARIRVTNDGSVASVSVAGPPFGGTAQGACMENVVRRARFPRFRRTTFDLTFPFSIRPVTN